MENFSPKANGPSQSIQALMAILDRLKYCNTEEYLEVNVVTQVEKDGPRGKYEIQFEPPRVINVGYTGDEILEIQRLAWLLIEEIDAMPYPVYPHAR